MDMERQIIENMKKTLALTDDQGKERVLAFSEGMAFQAARQQTPTPPAAQQPHAGD